MFVLFFLAMMIGVSAPLFRGGRGSVLVIGTCMVMALMIYSYVTSTPEALGAGASISNRKEALFVSGCEFGVLLLAMLSRSHKAFFWVGYAAHTLLAILCAGVVIWLKFFWHW